jgi:WASH complex subunit FAM21
LLDEEDNLFAPPKLTDEDFSPFGSRGGLFSGGQGLFDDEDEEVSQCRAENYFSVVSS